MAMRSSSNISFQLSSRWGSDKIYSVYLHVSSSVKLGQSVDIDKAIATVHKYDPNNSHLHWEIRRYASMMDAPISAKCKTKSLEVGPSYTNTGTNPDDFGYINPSRWVEEN
jgi:murein DD-endopeptidase MepM/ murein hydrolase activator NlpD